MDFTGLMEMLEPILEALGPAAAELAKQLLGPMILTALGVPWELRFDYFPAARPVRRPAPAAGVAHEEARTA